MPINFSSTSRTRLETSLIRFNNDGEREYLTGKTEMGREADKLDQTVSDMEADLLIKIEKDKFYTDAWNYFLGPNGILLLYWSILTEAYDTPYEVDLHNSGIVSPSTGFTPNFFVPPELPLIDTTFLSDTNVISYIEALKSEFSGKTNANFNIDFHPSQYKRPGDPAYIQNFSSLPVRGAIFENRYVPAYSDQYILKLILTVNVWETSPPQLFNLLGKILGSYPLIIGDQNEATLSAELLTNFDSIRDSISSNIGTLISLIPEDEYTSYQAALISLKAHIDGMSSAGVPLNHVQWKIDLDSGLSSIKSGMDYFLDNFYFLFRKRASGSGGTFSVFINEPRYIEELRIRAQELRSITTFLDIHGDEPIPIITKPTVTGNAGIVEVKYDLADTSGYSHKMVLAYTLDGGASWNETTNITSTPDITNVFNGNDNLVNWDTSTLTHGNLVGVMVRIQDENGGSAVYSPASNSFNISNMPSISKPAVTGNSGVISIKYDLLCLSNANHEIYLEYSLDGGTSWSEDANVTGTPHLKAVSPGTRRGINWNSLALLPNDYTSALIRVRDRDSGDDVISPNSDPFDIKNLDIS